MVVLGVVEVVIGVVVGGLVRLVLFLVVRGAGVVHSPTLHSYICNWGVGMPLQCFF